MKHLRFKNYIYQYKHLGLQRLVTNTNSRQQNGTFCYPEQEEDYSNERDIRRRAHSPRLSRLKEYIHTVRIAAVANSSIHTLDT